MIYTAEILKVGDFQAPTKKLLIEKIVKYFCENEDETCEIVSIWCEFKDESTREFCDEVVRKIQKIVDENILESRKSAKEERIGEDANRSDYYSNLI